MGGHLASISHSSRNFLAKIREMCVKCPFWRYKRGRFGKKPRFTVKGVKVLENRLGLKPHVGSNPTPSAIVEYFCNSTTIIDSTLAQMDRATLFQRVGHGFKSRM